MIKQVEGLINHCTCDLCKKEWKSLIVPTVCYGCGSRRWNGEKRRGRRLLPKPPKEPRKRQERRGIEHYSEDVW